MGEAKKIVIEHFPVERLPEELKRGLESGQFVRVTVETSQVDASETRISLRSFLGSGKGVYSEEEAVSYIRKLRDE